LAWALTRRDPDIDTVWTAEHLLKSTDDVRAYLELPDEVFAETIDVRPLIEEEEALGDRGIVMVDTEDPLCAAATLFSMQDFTVFAMTENALCHRLLAKHARYIQRRTEEVARQLPGRLWRIYGPEFATEPYLTLDPWYRRSRKPAASRGYTCTGGFATSWITWLAWALTRSTRSSRRRRVTWSLSLCDANMAANWSYLEILKLRTSRTWSRRHLRRKYGRR
jgi:hypothetical protein